MTSVEPQTQQQQPPQQTIRFLIHKSAVGPLIGQQGSTVQGISQQSGANVVVESFTSYYQELTDAIKERILLIRFTDTNTLVKAIAGIAPIIRKAREIALTSFNKTIPDNEHLFKGLIHVTAVHRLLAQSGALIKLIQQTTGCNIKILSRLPQSSEFPIHFKGSIEQVTAAILATLEYFADHSGENTLAYRPYRLTAPVTSMTDTRPLRVPGYAVPYIIGKGGSRLKFITQSTSCYVTIDRNIEYNRYTKAQFYVKGPANNIKIAVSMIFAAVKPASEVFEKEEQEKALQHQQQQHKPYYTAPITHQQPHPHQYQHPHPQQHPHSIQYPIQQQPPQQQSQQPQIIQQ